MAITCPRCGKQYDVTLFQFGKSVRCDCGQTVDAGKPHAESGPGRPPVRLARRAARIKALIMDEAVPRTAILEEVEALRAEHLRHGTGDPGDFEEGILADLKRIYRLGRDEDLYAEPLHED